MTDIVERLRALVIMDEVRSDNQLGRDAADEIERLREALEQAVRGAEGSADAAARGGEFMMSELDEAKKIIADLTANLAETRAQREEWKNRSRRLESLARTEIAEET